MADEDEDGDSGSEESDESDEEDNGEEVPIPQSWDQHFSSAMTVNNGHDFA